MRLTLLTNPDICNLHCPLCFLNQRKSPFGMGEMPFEVAQTAIEKFCLNAGTATNPQSALTEVIPSTMGEPLLYSQFEKLVVLCESHKIPLNITTNGTFPGVWGTEDGLERLVRVSRDIKVSCMGFSTDVFQEMMPGISFEQWKSNVLRLLKVRERHSCDRNSREQFSCENLATISLQVTLHRKNLHQAEDILHWAESIGIHRIKWNPAVFLSATATDFRNRYELSSAELDELRQKLQSKILRSEGSLFFVRPESVPFSLASARHSTAVFQNSSSAGPQLGCPFADELWIYPDGSESHCPNPERRFGNPAAPEADCSYCPMRR